MFVNKVEGGGRFSRDVKGFNTAEEGRQPEGHGKGEDGVLGGHSAPYVSRGEEADDGMKGNRNMRDVTKRQRLHFDGCVRRRTSHGTGSLPTSSGSARAAVACRPRSLSASPRCV